MPTPNAATLINQTSGIVEYYTPESIIESARVVLGEIELDPASSAVANERVKALQFFSKEDDGLTLRWCVFGGHPRKVWMNHPFGRGLNEAWINKLCSEFDCGHVSEACCITYACTSERWFQPLLRRPQCFLSPRTNYLLPDGTVFKGVTKGSVVTYFGSRPEAFCTEFAMHGVCK
jgi:ParB family chromosome partitioning protein